MWIIISSLFIVLVFIVFMSLRFSDIETPKYKLLSTIGKVEIRKYPKMITATTKLSSPQYDEDGSNGFRTVANYIFGGNSSNKKIAMTAPVIMNMGDSSTLSFVMPSEYELKDLPAPNTSNVTIKTESVKILAVLKYGGYSSDSKIQKYASELRSILVANKVQIIGPLLYMGYNAPWDVINRRNEVAFEISWE